MIPDLSRISFTARLTAYYRRFSDVAFAADVAAMIDADAVFHDLVREHAIDPKMIAFYGPVFEARHRSVGALLARSGLKRVLELASGFSMRGVDVARDPDVVYVETDLPGVTDVKAPLVAELRERHGLADYGNLHLTSADALDLAALRAAARPLGNGPIAVVTEGLAMYLSRDEQTTLARNVRALLDGGGVWITADFSIRGAPTDTSPGRLALRRAITGLTDRQLDASQFESEAQLIDFFASAGLRGDVHSQIDVAGDLVSVRRMGLPPAIVDRLRPTLRVWVLGPT